MSLFTTKHKRFSLTTLQQLFFRKLSIYLMRNVASVRSCDKLAIVPFREHGYTQRDLRERFRSFSSTFVRYKRSLIEQLRTFPGTSGNRETRFCSRRHVDRGFIRLRARLGSRDDCFALIGRICGLRANENAHLATRVSDDGIRHLLAGHAMYASVWASRAYRIFIPQR